MRPRAPRPRASGKKCASTKCVEGALRQGRGPEYTKCRRATRRSSRSRRRRSSRGSSTRRPDVGSLRFLLDGKRLNGDQTPEDVDVEDGDQIDVFEDAFSASLRAAKRRRGPTTTGALIGSGNARTAKSNRHYDDRRRPRLEGPGHRQSIEQPRARARASPPPPACARATPDLSKPPPNLRSWPAFSSRTPFSSNSAAATASSSSGKTPCLQVIARSAGGPPSTWNQAPRTGGTPPGASRRNHSHHKEHRAL